MWSCIFWVIFSVAMIALGPLGWIIWAVTVIGLTLDSNARQAREQAAELARWNAEKHNFNID